MQQIISIVETLLFEHDCVVIPQFGGFVLQRQSAQLQGEVLLPPRTLVGFNRQLTHDDGLLVSVYAQRQRLPYLQAKKAVADIVVQMLTTLQADGMLCLGRLGEMRIADNLCIFTPAAGSFLPHNLGRVSLYPQKRTETPVLTIRLHKHTLHYAAACALGFCLLAVSPKGADTTTTRYATLNPVNYTEILAERQAALQAAQAEELAQQQKEAEERGHFHIVVASLDRHSAERYAERLQQAGYNGAFVLPYRREQYRVVLASYATKKQALREMQQLRKAKAYRRAWVYCE